MSKPVNLRQYRKRKQREDKARSAEANRVKHGTPKAGFRPGEGPCRQGGENAGWPQAGRRGIAPPSRPLAWGAAQNGEFSTGTRPCLRRYSRTRRWASSASDVVSQYIIAAGRTDGSAASSRHSRSNMRRSDRPGRSSERSQCPRRRAAACRPPTCRGSLLPVRERGLWVCASVASTCVRSTHPVRPRLVVGAGFSNSRDQAINDTVLRNHPTERARMRLTSLWLRPLSCTHPEIAA